MGGRNGRDVNLFGGRGMYGSKHLWLGGSERLAIDLKKGEREREKEVNNN